MQIIAKKLNNNDFLISSSELMKLINKVSENENIEFIVNEGEISTEDLMELQLRSKSFDFLYDENEDIYTLNDIKVSYK